jgi:hypothetical protein
VPPTEVSQRVDAATTSRSNIELEATPSHVVSPDSERLAATADDLTERSRRASTTTSNPKQERTAREGLVPYYAGRNAALLCEFFTDSCLQETLVDLSFCSTSARPTDQLRAVLTLSAVPSTSGRNSDQKLARAQAFLQQSVSRFCAASSTMSTPSYRWSMLPSSSPTTTRNQAA